MRIPLAVLGTILAAGCGQQPPEPGVAASIEPLAALTRLVVGDRLPVVTLLPPGRSPHDFEPNPADLTRAQHAILFVSVGNETDQWVGRTMQAASGQGPAMMSLASVAPPGADPHLWLDLDVVAAFLPVLVEGLIRVDPEGEAEYRERGLETLRSLRRLDEELREQLAPVAEAPFVLLHPAFASFVSRYGLNLVGVLSAHPEGEIPPRHMGDVARMMSAENALVIFAEPQLSSRAARALALEISGRVVFLDPLGGSDATGDVGYLDLLRFNGRQLVENLR